MESDTRPEHPTSDDPLFRDYLLALLDAGNAIVQGLKRQAEAEPSTPPVDLSEPFERVSRAMRRTILLARHIAQSPAASSRPHQRAQARKRIIREVEDAIQRRARNPEAAEAEFADRLDSPDLEEDIANRPVADIILDITRDLGLVHMPGTHPWARRTPQDIEHLRQRAIAPPPEGPYQPAPHDPETHGYEKPPPRPYPIDEATETRKQIALAKLLAST